MINNCFVIGFNHHLSGVSERSYYSISAEQQEIIFQKAKQQNFPAFCIMNTCNRTEIYGFGNMQEAIRIYSECTLNDAALEEKMMKKRGIEAVEHLFKVAAGLDSQIIGDLEILGQFKNAFQVAKKQNVLNGYFERLANTCIQASKEIRSNTSLSGGTISLSYAIVKLLRERENKTKILLIGAGDFGKGIAQNIRHYLPAADLSLTNRTAERAQHLASTLSCTWLDYTQVPEVINDFDVVITAIGNSKNYFVTPSMISKGSMLFFDMSVPRAIDPALADTHEVITVDDASSIINRNIETRKANLPVACAILDRFVSDFTQWSELYQQSDSIRTWKKMIGKLSDECPYISRLEGSEKSRLMSRKMSEFATYIKANPHLKGEPEQIIFDFLSGNHPRLECMTKAHTFEISSSCSACSKKY